jgi:virulence factor Mce-like protein
VIGSPFADKPDPGMTTRARLRVGLRRLLASGPIGSARRRLRVLPKAVQIGIGVVVAALVAALVWIAVPASPTMQLTAEFAEAPGLFAGNYVDVLGVPVGKITAVTPGPNDVAVQMQISGNVAVPVDAHAVLEAPAVVNDRFVQLIPAYDGGPRLADGAVIPMSRTATPVSVDQIVDTLDTLAKALGPSGANHNGAVSELLHSLAQTFGHNGSQLHQVIASASSALTGFASHPAELAAALNNLGKLTQAAASNTSLYEAFAGNLATVSSSLASDDSDIGVALHELQETLGQIAGFVQDNQSTIGASVRNLDAFANALATQQRQLATVFDIGPLTLQNLTNAIDPDAAGGAALKARYDAMTESMNLVNTVCGSSLLRGLVLATNPKERTELDLDCLLNDALGSLSTPPDASSGPDLSLHHLIASGG